MPSVRGVPRTEGINTYTTRGFDVLVDNSRRIDDWLIPELNNEEYMQVVAGFPASVSNPC